MHVQIDSVVCVIILVIKGYLWKHGNISNFVYLWLKEYFQVYKWILSPVTLFRLNEKHHLFWPKVEPTVVYNVSSIIMTAKNRASYVFCKEKETGKKVTNELFASNGSQQESQDCAIAIYTSTSFLFSHSASETTRTPRCQTGPMTTHGLTHSLTLLLPHSLSFCLGWVCASFSVFSSLLCVCLFVVIPEQRQYFDSSTGRFNFHTFHTFRIQEFYEQNTPH